MLCRAMPIMSVRNLWLLVALCLLATVMCLTERVQADLDRAPAVQPYDPLPR
jgi:hypothetical protein